jgi:hypothetical protein
MEEIKTLLKNPYILSLFSLVMGAIIALIISKIRNKSGIFGYYIIFNRIGLSADDSVLGSVRVTWQGHEVRNLHWYTIEVENLTSTDYENIIFKVFSGNDTVMLNEQTHVVDSPDIIRWSDTYREMFKVDNGSIPNELQLNGYYHRREYLLPVFNRTQKLKFTYLCTKPNDDLDPGIYISTPSKGVRLKRLRNPAVIIKPIWGVPVPAAISRALVLSILVIFACGLFINNVWLASFISMAIGLSGQIFGALTYKIEKFIKDVILR